MTSHEQQFVSGWREQVALGSIPRLRPNEMFGQNPVIGTTPEEVWPLGGDHTWLSTGTTLFISSDDAGDTTEVIRVTGLDANWDQITVDVTLNGLTPAQIGDVLNWTTVFSMHQVSAAPAATGDIYAAVAGAAYTLGVPDLVSDVQGFIDMGAVLAPQASADLWLVVPRGCTGLIMSYSTEIEAALGVARSAETHLEVAELAKGATPDNPSWMPFRKVHDLSLDTVAEVHATETFVFPLSFPELTRIRLHSTATTNSILGGHIVTLWVPD